MAAPTKAQLATARDFLARAGRRIDGAATAARRPDDALGADDHRGRHHEGIPAIGAGCRAGRAARPPFPARCPSGRERS